MERAERIIALCLGLLIPPLLIPILWLTLGLTAITAVQRFVKVWRQAAVAPVTAERIELRRSRRQSRRVVRTERRRHKALNIPPERSAVCDEEPGACVGRPTETSAGLRVAAAPGRAMPLWLVMRPDYAFAVFPVG